MKTVHTFEIARASIPGTRHLRLGRNNQDFSHVLRTEDALIAVVSDGCGSTSYSEVGSRLLATLCCQQLAKALMQSKGVSGEKLFTSEWWWEEIRQEVLARIRLLAQEMGESWREILKEYFLATLVGCVIREDTSCIFACGDGYYALNGDLHSLGPFPGNKPPYLTYGITGSEITDTDPSLLSLQRQKIFPTVSLQSLLIGTDGVGDLLSLADQPFPAQEKLIGGIEQFWSEETYFTNPSWMQNVLMTINTEKKRVDWNTRNIQRFPGLLPDDTTLVTIKRKDGAS